MFHVHSFKYSVLKNIKLSVFQKPTYIRNSRFLSSITSTTNNAKDRVLSGIQPTGCIHIGNYLGALKQWVDNQDKYDNYFCIVDLHAITSSYDPLKLSEDTLRIAALYIACGIDPSKSNIFIQSHVRAHTELAWLLNCITPFSWLARMTQFKEKASSQGDNMKVGVLNYPVLMAADILLYQAKYVPVGEDQLQHLELARDICRRFNHQYTSHKNNNTSILIEPKALLLKNGVRIMSLLDATCKMSKSNPNDNSRINLLDSPDVIVKKIKKCKTDQLVGLEWNNVDRPECGNLISIYQLLSNRTEDDVMNELSSLQWGKFKPMLADIIIAHLSPIQKHYNEIIADKQYLFSVLNNGQIQANEVAESTLNKVKETMGILSVNKMKS